MKIIVLLIALTLGCRAESPPVDVAPAPQPAPPITDSPAAEIDAPAIDIPNALMPIKGVLVGGQPSIEQLEEAAGAGYRTIVNLRGPGEKGSWDQAPKAAELGLRYIEIPIAGAGDLNAENARKLAAIVDAPLSLPAMVHCASGNRVGGLFALKAFHVDGVSAEEALAAGLEAGLTRLEDTVKERLGLAE